MSGSNLAQHYRLQRKRSSNSDPSRFYKSGSGDDVNTDPSKKKSKQNAATPEPRRRQSDPNRRQNNTAPGRRQSSSFVIDSFSAALSTGNPEDENQTIDLMKVVEDHKAKDNPKSPANKSLDNSSRNSSNHLPQTAPTDYTNDYPASKPSGNSNGVHNANRQGQQNNYAQMRPQTDASKNVDSSQTDSLMTYDSVPPFSNDMGDQREDRGNQLYKRGNDRGSNGGHQFQDGSHPYQDRPNHIQDGSRQPSSNSNQYQDGRPHQYDMSNDQCDQPTSGMLAQKNQNAYIQSQSTVDDLYSPISSSMVNTTNQGSIIGPHSPPHQNSQTNQYSPRRGSQNSITKPPSNQSSPHRSITNENPYMNSYIQDQPMNQSSQNVDGMRRNSITKNSMGQEGSNRFPSESNMGPMDSPPYGKSPGHNASLGRSSYPNSPMGQTESNQSQVHSSLHGRGSIQSSHQGGDLDQSSLQGRGSGQGSLQGRGSTPGTQYGRGSGQDSMHGRSPGQDSLHGIGSVQDSMHGRGSSQSSLQRGGSVQGSLQGRASGQVSLPGRGSLIGSLGYGYISENPQGNIEMQQPDSNQTFPHASPQGRGTALLSDEAQSPIGQNSYSKSPLAQTESDMLQMNSSLHRRSSGHRFNDSINQMGQNSYTKTPLSKSPGHRASASSVQSPYANSAISHGNAMHQSQQSLNESGKMSEHNSKTSHDAYDKSGAGNVSNVSSSMYPPSTSINPQSSIDGKHSTMTSGYSSGSKAGIQNRRISDTPSEHHGTSAMDSDMSPQQPGVSRPSSRQSMAQYSRGNRRTSTDSTRSYTPSHGRNSSGYIGHRKSPVRQSMESEHNFQSKPVPYEIYDESPPQHKKYSIDECPSLTSQVNTFISSTRDFPIHPRISAEKYVRSGINCSYLFVMFSSGCSFLITLITLLLKSQCAADQVSLAISLHPLTSGIPQ